METQPAFDQLRQQAWDATQAGELRKALNLYEEALAWAQREGSESQIDRALCSRAAVLVVLGDATSFRQDLQRILLKNQDAETGFLSAYTLARAYDADGDRGKALFYSRIANRHAIESGNREQLASSHNQLGDFLVADSHFDQALEEFEVALENLPPGPSLRRAITLDNRGYCHVVRGRLNKGFRDLFESLRICRRLRARAFEASTRLSLACAYLDCGRYDAARRHARWSLDEAEANEQRMTVKYGLFILGETEKQAGNPLAARYYFFRLQEEFYPDAPNVPDLLLFLNVQSLVNIKA